MAAQRLWSVAFEYARDVCRLGLRSKEADRLNELLQEYQPAYQELAE